MKKKFSRMISMLLSLCLTLSVFAFVPGGVPAAHASVLPDVKNSGEWDPVNDPVNVYFIHQYGSFSPTTGQLTRLQTAYREGYRDSCVPATHLSDFFGGAHNVSVFPNEDYSQTLDLTFLARNNNLSGYVLMDYNEFLDAWNYQTSSVEWGKVDPTKVYVPDSIAFTGSRGNFTGTASYTTPQRDLSDSQMLYMETSRIEKADALSVSATTKPSLKLEYDGSRYERDQTGASLWKIPVTLTNTASYPIYTRVELSYYDNTAKCDITPIDQIEGIYKYYEGGNYYGVDPQRAIISPYSPEYAGSPVYFVAPGTSRTIDFEVPVSPPELEDHSITANINCVNLTSANTYTVRDSGGTRQVAGTVAETSVTTFFPQKAAIEFGLWVEGSYPKVIAPFEAADEPVQITIVGENLGSNHLDAATLSIRKATDDEGAAIPLHNQALYNQTDSKVSFYIDQNDIAIGVADDYIISFDDFSGNTNSIKITAQAGYDAPLWNTYGTMVISQFHSGNSEIMVSNVSESELAANFDATGGYDPLLIFRGVTEKIGVDTDRTDYLVHSGASINGVLKYFCKEDETDEALRPLRVTVENGDVIVQSQSEKAVLVYDNTVVASGKFRIPLYREENYSSGIMQNEEEDDKVKLDYGEGNDAKYGLDVRGIHVEAGGLYIYDGACSLTGKIQLGNVMPEFLESYFNAEAGATLDELQIGGGGLPGIKASMKIGTGFDLFSVVAAGGNFEFSMNTLPNAGEDTHIRLYGDVDLLGMISANGELVLEPAYGFFMPEKFYVFAEADFGIPLIPMFPVAMINGLGGGFDGLSSTIARRGYQYLPDISLTLSCSIVDITSKLVALNEGGFTLGTRGVKGHSKELTLLELTLLKNIGYSIQLTEGKQPLILPNPTDPGNPFSVYSMGVEIEAYGTISLVDYIVGTGSVWFAVDPSITDWDAVLKKLQGGDIGDAIWDITDCIDFLGRARVWAQIPAPLPFNGFKLVEAGAEISKTQMSLWAGMELWGGQVSPPIGLIFRFPYRDQSGGVSIMSVPTDIGEISGYIYDDAGNEIEVIASNLLRKVPISQSGLRLMDAGPSPYTTTVNADEPNILFSFESPTNAPANFTISGPDGDKTGTIDATGDNGWKPKYDEDGTTIIGYAAALNIDNPAEGDYTVNVTDNDDVTIDAYTILPLPTLEDVAYNGTNTVTFEAKNLDAEKTYAADLFVVPEADAETGMGEHLGSFDITNGNASKPAIMPINLQSGRYVITAVLSEVEVHADGNGNKTSLHSAQSDSFNHINPNTPSTPTNIAASANGNGTVKVTWDAVDGADGYQVQVLDASGNPVRDSEDNELTPILSDGTEAILQGGIYGDATAVTTGYEYGTDYTVRVNAFKNVKFGERIDESGATVDVFAPVDGKAAVSGIFKFTEPVPPLIGVIADDAKKAENSTNDWEIYVGKAPKVEITLDTGVKYSIDNGRDIMSGISNGTPVPLDPPAEGEHTFIVTAENAAKDSSAVKFTVIVDRTAPLLSLDPEITLNGGSLRLSGITDNDSITLALNGSASGFTRKNGAFTYEGSLSGTAIEITATDEAGNVTTVSRDIVAESSIYSALSVSTAAGGVVPLGQTPDVIVTGNTVFGDSPVTGATFSVTNHYGTTFDGTGAGTADSGEATVTSGVFTPVSEGTVLLTATYNGLSASAVIQIVNELPVTLSYEVIGGNSAKLRFAPPAGAISASVEYSTDGAAWTAYGSSFDPSAGTYSLSSLAKDTYHFFRVQVVGGINRGATNSVCIYVATPEPTAPPDSGGQTYYTTIFNSNGGSAVANASVESGKILTRPADPTRQGYIFTGWHTDAACTVQYDFMAKVTASFTLYAGWEKTGAVWDNPFGDVEAGDWFYDDVRYAFENGLMNGIGADAFGPQLETSRGMIATILWRIEGEPAPGGDSGFTDLRQDWYKNAVIWANEAGIVKGYGSLFGPDDPLLRQDMAVILLRYAEAMELELPKLRDAVTFVDAGEIADYAKTAVTTLYEAGIINGKGNNLFDPQGTATRVECAAMLHRFLEAVGK